MGKEEEEPDKKKNLSRKSRRVTKIDQIPNHENFACEICMRTMQ